MKSSQAIFPENHIRQMEFCEFMMENKMQRILKKTYWINEQLNIPVCTQNSQKLNVRAGNIAPFFIDGKYLTASPKSNYSKKSANSYCGDIWLFKAQCGRSDMVSQNYVSWSFNSNKWSIKWPPRSSHLSPNVGLSAYRHEFARAANLDELRNKIIQLCANTPPNLLRNIRLSLYHRFICLLQ